MNLSKKGNEVWGLLDETALHVSRTALRERFSHAMATLSTRLQNAPANPAVLREVQTALVELRKQLRLSGYDLSMGKYTLIFDGFRNDDAYGEFTRMTLFIDRSGVFYWQTGDDNHVTLADLLKRRLDRTAGYYITERHYLWYKWSKTALTLSGSATEREEDYLRLKQTGEADSLLFLSRLKGLR